MKKMQGDIIHKAGEEEMCVCPKCGFVTPRFAGTSCSDKFCPRCKVVLSPVE